VHAAWSIKEIFCRIIFRGPISVAASSKHGSGSACLLGLRVRIPPSAWMSDCHSRGVLPTVCVIVWSRNLKNEEAKARIWSHHHRKSETIRRGLWNEPSGKMNVKKCTGSIASYFAGLNLLYFFLWGCVYRPTYVVYTRLYILYIHPLHIVQQLYFPRNKPPATKAALWFWSSLILITQHAWHKILSEYAYKMSSGCCYSIHFDIYGKRSGYLLRDFIGMSCLRMGEIEIGVNAKRKRIAKLVSMESAEIRQSKMQYTFFVGRVRGRGGGALGV